MRRIPVQARDGSPGYAIPLPEMPMYLFKKPGQSYWCMIQYDLGSPEEWDEAREDYCVRISPTSYLQDIPDDDTEDGGITKEVAKDYNSYPRYWVWVPAGLLEPEINEYGEVAP